MMNLRKLSPIFLLWAAFLAMSLAHRSVLANTPLPPEARPTIDRYRVEMNAIQQSTQLERRRILDVYGAELTAWAAQEGSADTSAWVKAEMQARLAGAAPPALPDGGLPNALLTLRDEVEDRLRIAELNRERREQTEQATYREYMERLAASREARGNPAEARLLRRLAIDPAAADTPAPVGGQVMKTAPRSPGREALAATLLSVEPGATLPLAVGESRTVRIGLSRPPDRRVRISLIPLAEEPGGRYAAGSASIFPGGETSVSIRVRADRPTSFDAVHILVETLSPSAILFENTVVLDRPWVWQ